MSGAAVIGDWGSTHLRVWRLERGEVVERREGPGMLACPDPAAALAAAIGGWSARRLILSGMAGARDGLCEAPYVPCPASLDQWRSATQDCAIAGSTPLIAAGLSWRDATGRPDVMRGEETQIFGAMALDPDLAAGEHLLLLPGTHSKWVLLDDGVILGFRTCLTGELFALLGRSTLWVPGGEAGDGDDGFAAGLTRAEEGGPLPGLFEARAARLLDGRSGDWARGFASGLLIGAEVAEMAAPGTVVAIGDPALTARYGMALARRGVAMRVMDGEACAVAGLKLLDVD